MKSNVLPLQSGIIYGPVNSKRLGRSLGINLLSTTKKICSFNCIYCHYGITHELTCTPAINELPSIEEINREVKLALSIYKNIDYLTFSGNGEPMIYPFFEKVVKNIKQLRDELLPKVPIALLSNSSCLTQDLFLSALRLIDIRVFKLDTADEELFKKINRPCPGLHLVDIINALVKLSRKLPIIIQTIFIDGEVNNYSPEVLEKWCKVIKEINPLEVQIYSTDRPVAEKGIVMLDNEKLKELAVFISRQTKIKTIPYFAQTIR
ncbi:MAG: radical SAM protein [candidate division WOR-3 bacterium]|nr:radical SAM protein [candidate division WOR-3 bacterium]MCX7757600.1 radical SAM protein [candidate division WOR-3 bacterium]MDW7987284.1 radical SAM protein [candidate division WOR-3 bacterium]